MATEGVIFNERILESQRPNFFELLSQEAMHEALRPAFQYLTKVLVQTRPDWFEVVWKCADEVYLAFEILVQLYFMKRYDGSFSENFYSLKRVSYARQDQFLTSRDRIVSIVCLVFVPYLKTKLDQVFLRLQAIDDATPLGWWRGAGAGRLVAVLFFRTHPYFKCIWEGLMFLFRLLYLFKKTEFYSPLLYLSGLTLTRALEEQDPSCISSGNSSWSHWLLGNLAPIGVFSLRFLEWWYSEEKSQSVKMITSLPTPPPPKRMNPNPAGINLPSDPSLCPLCGRGRVQPTTLWSSGYVFCYACIHDYVQEQGECPVTCLPSTEHQLVRLYVPPPAE